MVVVLLSSDRHKKDTEQHRASISISLAYATDSSLDIGKRSIKSQRKIFAKKGVKYKRAGVIVTGLVPPTNNHQLHLFTKENPPKHKPLMRAIDKLNYKYGEVKLKLGNQDLERTWKMKQEHLSPKYTTNFKDIIKVK